MPTTLRRSAVALATALACLVLVATPASATTTHSATITGGTLKFRTGGGTTGFLGSQPPLGTTGSGCGSTLSIEEDGATGAFEIVQFSSTARFTVVGNNHYIAVMTRQGSTAGTYSGGAITSATLSLRVTLFNATNSSSTATDCAHGTTVVCRYTMTLHLTGTYTGMTTSGTVQLGGTGTVTGLPCTPPFSEYTAGTAEAVSWGFHLTT